MSGNKIQIGYGSDKPLSQKKGLYGTRRSGKFMGNGGFNGEPTVDFVGISDEEWARIFGVQSLPKWKQELLESGEEL